MNQILRRHLLALMVGVTTLAYALPAAYDMSAFARNGSDDGAGHDSGDDHGGSGSDSDGDSSGSDSDSDGDNSGSGDDSGDDNGGTSGSSDDSSTDDSSDDNSANRSTDSRSSSRSASRPIANITLTPDSLANVRAGSHVVVDQLGRQLEISVRTVNGQTVISAKPHGGAAKRNPGPITSINVVAASTVPGNDDGTPDQGQGDN